MASIFGKSGSAGSTPPLPAVPDAPPPPPIFGTTANKAAGQKQKPAASSPSFLGSGGQTSTAQKTLLGS